MDAATLSRNGVSAPISWRDGSVCRISFRPSRSEHILSEVFYALCSNDKSRTDYVIGSSNFALDRPRHVDDARLFTVIAGPLAAHENSQRDIRRERALPRNARWSAASPWR